MMNEMKPRKMSDWGYITESDLWTKFFKMIMSIIISQAISEYISAEGRPWISSSEYL